MHYFRFQDQKRALGMYSAHVTHFPICTLTHTTTDSLGGDMNHGHRSSSFFKYRPELASWLARMDSINVEHGHEHWGEGQGRGDNARAKTQRVEMGG